MRALKREKKKRPKANQTNTLRGFFLIIELVATRTLLFSMHLCLPWLLLMLLLLLLLLLFSLRVHFFIAI